MFRRGDSLLCSVEEMCCAHPLTSKAAEIFFFKCINPKKWPGKGVKIRVTPAVDRKLLSRFIRTEEMKRNQ